MADKMESPMVEEAKASMPETSDSLMTEKCEAPMESDDKAPEQDPPQDEDLGSNYMYGFTLMDRDELFSQIRVQDGYLECILPGWEMATQDGCTP